jgi:hypothetical protein
MRLFRINVWEKPMDVYSLVFYVRCNTNREAIAKVEQALSEQGKSAYNIHCIWIDYDGTFIE